MNCIPDREIEVADDKDRSLLIDGLKCGIVHDDQHCYVVAFEANGVIYTYSVDDNQQVAPGELATVQKADVVFLKTAKPQLFSAPGSNALNHPSPIQAPQQPIPPIVTTPLTSSPQQTARLLAQKFQQQQATQLAQFKAAQQLQRKQQAMLLQSQQSTPVSPPAPPLTSAQLSAQQYQQQVHLLAKQNQQQTANPVTLPASPLSPNVLSVPSKNIPNIGQMEGDS